MQKTNQDKLRSSDDVTCPCVEESQCPWSRDGRKYFNRYQDDYPGTLQKDWLATLDRYTCQSDPRHVECCGQTRSEDVDIKVEINDPVKFSYYLDTFQYKRKLLKMGVFFSK